ncbi:MAG: NRDE family protein [Desulfobacterales bacterium]
MCLLLIAYRTHPDISLVLAANRDEFYDRPTFPMARWPDAPHVIAGRDGREGGTWLGVTESGRVAALTNLRDPSRLSEDARSRGELPADFLRGRDSAMTYLQRIRRNRGRYNGFNLVVGDGESLLYYSNRQDAIVPVAPGIHGLSNHLLNSPWPKVLAVKAAAARLLNAGGAEDVGRWFDMLSDSSRPPDLSLPDTGVGLEWERILSAIFIRSDGYGTRSTSLVFFTSTGGIRFLEKTHRIQGVSDGGMAEFVLEGDGLRSTPRYAAPTARRRR